MAQIIGASIDLTKIDKSKIITGKTGAQYYNITIIVNDEPNQYGKDVAVQNEQTKEQRLAKEKPTYIGSGKVVWSKAKGEASNSQADDGLPF